MQSKTPQTNPRFGTILAFFSSQRVIHLFLR